jgi:SNF2 family DNA or RNA helicase
MVGRSVKGPLFRTSHICLRSAHAQVYITSYEALRSDLSMRGTYGPGHRHWDLVAIDEAQRIKNSASDLARSVKALKRDRSWALTGTPLENRLDDLISILDFVSPGRFDPSKMMVGFRQLLSEVQLRRRRSDVLKDRRSSPRPSMSN